MWVSFPFFGGTCVHEWQLRPRETVSLELFPGFTRVRSGCCMTDSMRNVRSKGPGEGTSKTQQCWTELSGKLQGSQEPWAASYPRVTARCGEASLGGWEKVKVGLGWGELVRGSVLSLFFLPGEFHSELGEAAESPSSGSCPWGEMG